MSKVTLKVEIEEKDYKALIGQEVFNIWRGNEILSTIFNAIKTAKLIEECDDCVSRHAVLEQTYNWSKDEFLRVTNPFDYLRKRINSLPPVLPKRNIVNCENFKFDEWDIGDKKAELWVIKDRLQIRHRGTIHNVDFPVLPKREQGKWITQYHVAHQKEYIYCSECREEFSYDGETGIEMSDYKYCPNCGAEMR